MEHAIIFATTVTVILLTAALLVVWSRRKTMLRALAIPLALIAASAGATAAAVVLGYGVPLVGGVTAPPGEAPLLSAKLLKDKGIYLTIDLPDQPRLYWMPWDKETAEKLEEMLSDPGNAGVMVAVPPFEWSWDLSPPSFQPLPQPKWMPDKPADSAPPAPHFNA